MELVQVSEGSRSGALAALGSCVRDADSVWMARDAFTHLPRAYVSVKLSQSLRVTSAPGLAGTDDDAHQAAGVVRAHCAELARRTTWAFDHYSA